MRSVFADTGYWIAISNSRDAWAEYARQAETSLGKVLIVTTDDVLVEYLAGMSGAGDKTRARAARYVRGLFSRSHVRVIPQSRQSFLDGLRLFEARPDKGYSLTDCISMNTMREHGMTAALTNDRHFSQEGFAVLMYRPVS